MTKSLKHAIFAFLVGIGLNCSCSCSCSCSAMAIGEANHNITPSAAPAFSDLPVKSAIAGNFATRLVFKSSRAKKYRTIISRDGIKAPNFAGHYRVVTWGCGSDCHQFAIVNRLNGQIYTSPTIKLIAGVMGNSEPRIDFRLESHLFILTGLINEEEEGKFYYKWTGSRLIQHHRAPIVKEDLD